MSILVNSVNKYMTVKKTSTRAQVDQYIRL